MHSAYYDSPLMGGLLVVISTSYLVILVGFGIRAWQYGRQVQLLWPWMLMGIFGLCALSGYTTRLAGMNDLMPSDTIVVFEHFILAALSLAYGAGQLLASAWPELFEPGPYPKLASGEGEEAAVPAAET